MTRTATRSPSWRRGAILAVVLLVIAAATLAATAALFFASAHRASVTAASRRTQSRALAWSGVQAVTEELASQRDALLRGQTPHLDASKEIFGPRSGPGERGVCRLQGAPVAQAGLLDANSAQAETLVRAGLSAGLAAEIVAARRDRPFGSTREIAGLPAWGAEGAGAADPLGMLTVFSFDPQVQAGLNAGSGSRGGGGIGAARLDISGGMTKELEGAAAQLFGPELTERLRAAIGALAAQGGAGPGVPGSLGELLQRLLGAGVRGADAAKVLDACELGSVSMRSGLVSVNHAGEKVLAAIPGFDTDAAKKIVSAREQLSDDERAGLGWLLERQVLTPAQLAGAADVLTTRCTQWRVVIESGVTSSTEAEAPLRDRVVLEAVIDVSEARARVAYLRDVTMLPAASWLDALALADERTGAAGAKPTGERPSEAPPASPGNREPVPPSSGSTSAPNVQAQPAPPRRGSGAGRVGRWTTGGNP